MVQATEKLGRRGTRRYQPSTDATPGGRLADLKVFAVWQPRGALARLTSARGRLTRHRAQCIDGKSQIEPVLVERTSARAQLGEF